MLGKWSPKSVLIVGGVVVIGAWYLKNKAAETVQKVGTAINPVNRDNVFYSGVNEVGEAVTGREDWSLGTWLYEVTHDDEEELNPPPDRQGM